jgi:hypothetical protein
METRVRAYTIGHSQDVRDFITDYQRLLQLAIDEIWARIGGLRNRLSQGEGFWA